MRRLLRFLYLICAFICFSASAQQLKDIQLNKQSVVLIDNKGYSHTTALSLVSYELNTRSGSVRPENIDVSWKIEENFKWGVKGIITFTNSTADTLHLFNVVPFGRSDKEVFITGLGDHRLSRTHLFLPNRKPVNVIVPDNAWELGYRDVTINDTLKAFALARRDLTSLVKAERKRFETIIAPGGSVRYFFYADLYQGEWQEGLRIAFQQRKLYDLDSFDESLYQREDLKWIRKAYVMHLMMAWDKDFYDIKDGSFHLNEFIKRGKTLYGGDDAICIWPTWPALGVDQRNQFDMYRDLPGGLNQIRTLSDSLHAHGVKFFVAYNPWDESTRSEGHLQGLAELIKATSADGVVLDTKGESSKELQEAADAVRPGVVMYSEGMAVPKDMPGIVSGRVHNALYYPPILNLNKLIRPDFSIFRVAEVYKEPILREYALSFFNGYGTEINQFAPGHPEWEEEQHKFLGTTTRVLRDNSETFTSGKLTPLIPTLRDSIWVNRWEHDGKVLYTAFNLKSEGWHAPLFEFDLSAAFHVIDIYHHEDMKLKKLKSKFYAIAKLDGFKSADLGTNNEGSVTCIARFRPTLQVNRVGDRIKGYFSLGASVKIWKGNPSYEKKPVVISTGSSFEISISEKLGRYEGKIVIQEFSAGELTDEQIIYLTPGTPKLISSSAKTSVSKERLNMMKIPAGKFLFKATHGDEFIPYPKDGIGQQFEFNSFYVDKFPVTNIEFKKFLEATLYKPGDSANFLKHWRKGSPVKGEENFPVVYVSYEDAQAYAKWAGKRLPTELEWQYAAQTSSLNEWPWKQAKPVTRKEQVVNETLTVSAIEGIDPKMCNLGDGKLYAVGSYPKGANPYGLHDLTGCVWQLTNDVYESGSYRYIIIKGGSYFKPSSSWWYVQGGPRELHYRQFLLRVSQGFERNATVGFRCVKD